MNVWANTVITEKGLALLAKLTQGNTLNIVEAVTGAGWVTPGLLQKQTAVTDPKTTMVFRPVSYPEIGKCSMPVTMTNEGLATGYEATQVGIFANDPDEGKILFFIAQSVTADQGTTIPSETEMPGYSAEWTFLFKYGQADGISVTVSPANTISRAELEDYCDNQLVPEIPNLHVWKKLIGQYTATPVSNATLFYYAEDTLAGDGKWSDQIQNNGGSLSLLNSSAVEFASAEDPALDALRGQYVESDNHVLLGTSYYLIPEDAVFYYSDTALCVKEAYKLTGTADFNTYVGFVAAGASDAYPASGDHLDGYRYEYQGQLGGLTPYTYGTEDLTAGTSELETGKLYFVYE